MRFLILSLMLCSMGCAGFKDSARDAARAAIAEALPAIKEAGRELADHATARLAEAGAKVIEGAKNDLGGALGQIPALAKEAGAKAAADAVAARVAVEDPAKAAEFQRRVETDGLPAALEWLFGGGGLVIAAGLARLYWRTRGALRTVVAATESSPEVKAKVAASGGKAFDAEIQAALKG